MSILVPAHLHRKLATENLVKAVVGVVNQAGEQGYPVAVLRERFRVLEVPTRLADFVEARLVREKILVLRGDRLFIGELADIRAFVSRSKWDESQVLAVAPEKPSGVSA